MKKAILVSSCILLAVALICTFIVIKHAEKSPEVALQAALENIRENFLDEKALIEIIDPDSPVIEEVIYDSKPSSIRPFKKEADLIGKPLYKIKFATEQDGLLGPIVFYADKRTGKLVGGEIRF